MRILDGGDDRMGRKGDEGGNLGVGELMSGA